MRSAPSRYVPRGTVQWYSPVAREYSYMQATHRASPAQSPRQAAARCSPPRLARPGLFGDCSSGLQRALAPTAHCEALVRASGRSRIGGWTAQFRHCVAAWATRKCLFVARPSVAKPLSLFLYSVLLKQHLFLSLLRRRPERHPSPCSVRKSLLGMLVVLAGTRHVFTPRYR